MRRHRHVPLTYAASYRSADECVPKMTTMKCNCAGIWKLTMLAMVTMLTEGAVLMILATTR